MRKRVLDKKSTVIWDERRLFGEQGPLFTKVYSINNSHSSQYSSKMSYCYILNDFGSIYSNHQKMYQKVKCGQQDLQNPLDIWKLWVYYVASELKKTQNPQKVLDEIFGHKKNQILKYQQGKELKKYIQNNEQKSDQLNLKQLPGIQNYIFKQLTKIPIQYGDHRKFDIRRFIQQTNPLYGFTMHYSTSVRKEEKQILLVCHRYDWKGPKYQNTKLKKPQKQYTILTLQEVVINLTIMEGNIEHVKARLLKNLRKDVVKWLIMYEWAYKRQYPYLNPTTILYNTETNRFSLSAEPGIAQALGYKSRPIPLEQYSKFLFLEEMEMVFETAKGNVEKLMLNIQYLRELVLECPFDRLSNNLKKDLKRFCINGQQQKRVQQKIEEKKDMQQNSLSLLKINEYLELQAVVCDIPSKMEQIYGVKTKFYQFIYRKYQNWAQNMRNKNNQSYKKYDRLYFILFLLNLGYLLAMFQISSQQEKQYLIQFYQHRNFAYNLQKINQQLIQSKFEKLGPLTSIIKQKISLIKNALNYYGFNGPQSQNRMLSQSKIFNHHFCFDVETIEEQLLIYDNQFFFRGTEGMPEFIQKLMRLVLNVQRKINSTNVDFMHYQVYRYLMQNKSGAKFNALVERVQEQAFIPQYVKLKNK